MKDLYKGKEVNRKYHGNRRSDVSSLETVSVIFGDRLGKLSAFGLAYSFLSQSALSLF